MAARPTGTVTFLFTDIEGSTRLWEARPDAMSEAVAKHDALLRAVFDTHGGYVFATGGDGFAVAFTHARDAVDAAAAGQSALDGDALLKVRMGIHTGEVQERDGDYFGPAVNRAARIMSAGHGGQVLVSQATTELLVARPNELVDLGVHRLRDLSRAERLHQLGIVEHPALRTLDSLPTNLPVQLTAFIGREREMDDVRAALAASRLVTLTGAGGVGKTRLALHVAADLVHEYADGVYLVDLAALSDAEAVPEAVAAALEVHQRPGMTFVESIVDFLRTREMLLLLDNCEHVLSHSALLVDSIVRSCPSVRILATSREGLGVPGEQTRTVPSLPVPPLSASSVEAIRDHAAARLFVDRAQHVRDGFRLDATNSDAVATIVQQLDGIPLAIELAAARVRAMGPAEVAARLGERFRLLTGGSRVAIERHQTLRATVDWSYGLLSETDRAVFERLSVFAGGFTLEAAQAVVADHEMSDFDVLDRLTDLVSKSMIAIDDDAEGGVRYRLLETLRQYGRERLEQRGESDAMRRRHAEYFTAFAERADVNIRGPDEAVWVRKVGAEIDNLRVAFRWAVGIGELDLALRLVVALGFFGWGRESAGVHGWAAEAIALPGADRYDLFARAAGFASIGTFNTIGDSDLALAQASRALEVSGSTGAHPGGWPQLTIGSVHLLQGRAVEGEVAWTLAVREAERDDDPKLIAFMKAQAYCAVHFQGRSAEAASLLRDLLTEARQLGWPSLLSDCAAVLSLAVAPDDPASAVGYAELAVAEGAKVNNLKTLGIGLMALGASHAALGDTTEALRAYRRAVEFADLKTDLPMIAVLLDRLIPLLATTVTDHSVDEHVVALSAALDGYLDGRYALSAELADARAEVVSEVKARLGRDAAKETVGHRSLGEVLTLALEAIDRVLAPSTR